MSERAKAMEVLQSSNVLNAKVTLGEIMETASRLESLNPGELASWTLISKDYVYKGDVMEEILEQIKAK